MSFKRKRGETIPQTSNDVDTSKPSALFKPTGGRKTTLSVALPGSIISNAQTHELKTALAGHIARALAVFCVDEVVIFDDGQNVPPKWQNDRNGGYYNQYQEQGNNNEQSYTGYSDPCHFLMHILSYLETPPHLRKHLFPLHPNLRTAGTLPSLDMPHHLRTDEWCQYREGVTIEDASSHVDTNSAISNSKGKKSKKSNGTSIGSVVEAGLRQRVKIHETIPSNTRVTVKFPAEDRPINSSDYLVGEATSPDFPREEDGYYWGYAVRRAPSLSTVFTECTYDGGYDLSFGTSERGVPLRDAIVDPSGSKPDFEHMLVVFGGVQGLEAAVKADADLVEKGVQDPEALFDHWINLHPGQGSRTIRTEEAVWMGLMGLRDVFAQ
ncbi:MAG: hypothetical protein M4579_003155 [Chaenotheca gracillima]|nr:MAG: hypothetical protein M4579_003155 [Chaenotheca gracillima]